MAEKDNMRSGTAAGLFQFLDYLVDKGYAPVASIRPLRQATRKVLEGVDGAQHRSVSIAELDVGNHFERFVTLRGDDYKRESLAAYRQRFEKTVGMYRDFLDQGSDWKPPTFAPSRLRAARRTVAEQSNGRGASIQAELDITDVVPDAVTTPLLDYPFPLAGGELAYLRLPQALTSRDAARIGAFVATLAIDDKPSDDPS